MERTGIIQRTTSLLRTVLFVLAAIGIAMVIRRVLTIKGVLPDVAPGGRPAFDGTIALHPVFTFLHIIPGAVFMVLGVLLFIPAIRRTRAHLYQRIVGWFLITGYIVGLSALALPFVLQPIGGINEAAASIFFGLYFLVALTMAWRHAHQMPLQREWIIRAFAVALAVATIRPIVVLFFIFSHQPPQVFFGTAFWLGFTLHAIVAETWINFTRPEAAK
ncbi:MAG TPA: DUF2306 domain-containing protein [Puia sp.]|nr:DUF2306 domain-containing protein [Puia sp.]